MSKLYSYLTYNHQSKLTTAIRTVWNKFRLTGKVPEQGESLLGSHSLSSGVDIFCNYHYFTKTRTSHWYLAINISAAPIRILAANPEGSLLPQSLTESTDQTSLLGSTLWGSRVSLCLSWARRFSRKSLNLILLFTPRWRLNILRKTIARSVLTPHLAGERPDVSPLMLTLVPNLSFLILPSKLTIIPFEIKRYFALSILLEKMVYSINDFAK